MMTRCGRIQALALAIVLAIGAGLVWAVLVAIGSAIVDNTLVSSPHSVNENVLIMRDGTPVIQSIVDDDYRNPTYRTLDGKRIGVGILDATSNAGLGGPGYLEDRYHYLPWEQRIQSIPHQEGDSTQWYFWHDAHFRGHAYLVGYDMRSNQKIGYIGRHGFRPDEPPLEEQFPVDGNKMFRFWQIFVNYSPGGGNMENLAEVEPLGLDASGYHWLLADDGLMRINLKERTVNTVRKGTDLISAVAIDRPRSTPTTPSAKFRFTAAILVRTPDRVLILDLKSGKEMGAYTLPAELRDVFLEWRPLAGNQAVGRKSYDGDRLFWFDAAGKIVRREQVHLQKPPRRIPKIVEDIEVSLAVPSPGAIVGFFACYPWNGQGIPYSLDYSVALGKALTACRLILLIAGGISVVLAGLCFLRQRKYGLPWTAVWTLFVLLFGMPAFLGYLFHRVWPARLPCPNCQRRVPRDRPACFACGHEFPAPAAKGIEVFA